MPYLIQGKSVSLATEPFLEGDKHFVSLREIAEALGGSLAFDNSTKVASVTIAPWTAPVEEGNTSLMASSNGKEVPVTLSAPPYVENDEMFVPFDFFRDAFGYQVAFNDDTVSITNPNLPVG